MNIPKYRSHKEVQALKIKEVEKKKNGELNSGPVLHFEKGESLSISPEYIKKHKPVAGGYYVKYADGYESFSPAEAFEEGYSLVVEEQKDVDHPEQRQEQQPDEETVLEQMADKIIQYTNEQVPVSNDDEYFQGFVAGQLKMCEEFGGKERATKIEALLHHESRIWVLQNLGVIKTDTAGSIESSAGKLMVDFKNGEGTPFERALAIHHSPSDKGVENLISAETLQQREPQQNERPLYQSSKTVSAVQIKLIEYNDDQTATITPVESNVEPFTVNQGYLHSQKPGEGGYHVITDEGVHLYYDQVWFEKNYRQVTEDMKVYIADMSYQEDAENYRQLENEIAEMYKDESNDLVTIGEHVADHFGFLSMG